MLKRHAIHVLRYAGLAQAEVARLVGVGLRSVQRIETEPPVTPADVTPVQERRPMGRPAKAEPFRPLVVELLTQEPTLLAVEILRQAKLRGYTGPVSLSQDD